MWATLLESRNLVFLLPLFAGFSYLLLLAVSGADLDGDGDFDLDLDPDHSPIEDALSFLGVGRIPIAFVLIALCISWGVSGLVSQQILDSLLGSASWLSTSLSLTFALVSSIFLTKWSSRLLSRMLPKSESYASSRQDLVGVEGSVRFTVTETFGTVQVVDNHGTLLEVEARSQNSGQSFPSGSTVRLFRYHSEDGYYTVIDEEGFIALLEG